MANSTIESPDNPTVTIKNDTGTNSSHDFTAFALVPTFFLLGLIGVIICHVLKRKGYRCTTEAEEQEKHGGHDCDGLDRDLEMGGMEAGQDVVGKSHLKDASSDITDAFLLRLRWKPEEKSDVHVLRALAYVTLQEVYRF